MKLKDDTTPARSSGPGAAHVRWSMFGARGPMLEEHDKGGGSGGQKPAGEGSEGTTDDGDDAGGDKAEAKFTQADLDRIVNERLERDRRERGKSKAKPDSSRPESKKQKAEPESSTWVFEFTDALDAVVEETGVKPSRGLKSRMRADFQREQPDDPDAWIKSWFDDAGLKKPDTQNTQQQQQSSKKDGGEGAVDQKKTGNGSTISDKGGAGGTVLDFEAKLSERPLELTKLDVERLYEKHGEEKANILIRDSVNRKLAKLKLVADPRRGKSN